MAAPATDNDAVRSGAAPTVIRRNVRNVRSRTGALPAGGAANPRIRPGSAPRIRLGRLMLGALTALAAVPTLAACGDAPADPLDPTASPSVGPTLSASRETAARTQLAALAAAAADRHMVARYTLSKAGGGASYTITVTSATDGSWRVDIPGGVFDGVTDVSVVRAGNGLFQCVLPGTGHLMSAGCVRAAAPDGQLPGYADPRVQHPFLDWPDVLTDRQAPLAVSTSPPLPGARGTCFSVDSTSASLRPPLDVGIYCYETDGTLTAARFDYGTLRLVGAPGAAPATVTLPAPVTGDQLLPIRAD